MAATKYSYQSDKPIFMDEQTIWEILTEMEQNVLLNTDPVLLRDTEHSMNSTSFCEKHATYLKEHPKVNPKDYLANLHTMIKIRTQTTVI